MDSLALEIVGNFIGHWTGWTTVRDGHQVQWNAPKLLTVCKAVQENVRRTNWYGYYKHCKEYRVRRRAEKQADRANSSLSMGAIDIGNMDDVHLIPEEGASSDSDHIGDRAPDDTWVGEHHSHY